jgi:hypothetical protein
MGSLYGFEVKGDLPLSRLNSAAGMRGELLIEAGVAPPDLGGRQPATRLTGEGGRVYYASYELGPRCLLHLPPSGDFLLEPAAARIAVFAADEDRELREHRIASAAACTLLASRSDLALHAAAVEAGGGAIVFCGPTRRGKSTLVRALGEAGHPVLSEDGVVLALDGDGSTAYPGARGVRMRVAAARGATAVQLLPDPGPREPAPGPIAAVLLLDERGERLEVEALAPARALALLAPHLVHSGGRQALAAAFGRLAQLLGSVPAFRVSLPDRLAALPGAAAALLDAIGVRD